MKCTKPNGYITLITVIAISAVGSLVALLILFSGVSASKTSLSTQQSAQAKAAADGCTELALAAIQANIALSTPVTANHTIDTTTESICSYTISGVAPDYVIDSTGTVDSDGRNIVRKARVVLNRVGPTLNIYSWQELP
jgi:hypothetical protein